MYRAVIFGGTTEGRELCEICAKHNLPILCCVATEDGARAIQALQGVHVRVGRLEAMQMTALLRNSALVVDATHPYAQNASRNIIAACHAAGVPLLRVAREYKAEDGCIYFACMDDLLAWLEKEPGSVFVTMGSSCAPALSRLSDYENRIWMRILPSLESLRICLDLGYRPKRLICMQGPFSQELNRAMFKAANANILVTKHSGIAGGFSEKVQAAKSLGMKIAVLSRSKHGGGVSLEEAALKLTELKE